MLFGRRRFLGSAVLAFVIAGAAAGWAIKGQKDLQPVDFSVLADQAKTQKYDTLVEAARSRATSSREFHFVVMGDSRGNMEVASEIYRQAASENPAFILHTGDVVSKGTVEQYRDYHFPLLKLLDSVPLIPIPGNHEKGSHGDFAGFKAIYGTDRFSFDTGDTRFVAVNDAGPDRLTSDDLRYIELELEKPGAARKFVLLHVPPVFVEQLACKQGNPSELRGFTENAEAFHDLMQREQVKAVFLGHDHGFAALTIDGVSYFITAGAGADLYRELTWLTPIHHYLDVSVGPQGVREELVRMDGSQWIRTPIEPAKLDHCTFHPLSAKAP